VRAEKRLRYETQGDADDAGDMDGSGGGTVVVSAA